MEENKKEKSLRNIYRIINWILAIFILVFSTYTLRYSGEYELYVNKDNKDRIYTYVGEENFRTDSEVKKIIYEEVWDNHQYKVFYENGEEETLYLENIPWQNNLIKEEAIYIPVRNLGITFIFVIILILNIMKMRKKFKRDENQLMEKNISIMITTVLTLMILCNFILGLTTPFLMIPILAVFIFGGAGVIGLISYYIERKNMRRKSSSEFFKSLLLNYVLLLMIYIIYIIVWAGNSVMELNIFMSILLVSGETILGYIIGRMIDIPNYKKM